MRLFNEYLDLRPVKPKPRKPGVKMDRDSISFTESRCFGTCQQYFIETSKDRNQAMGSVVMQ